MNYSILLNGSPVGPMTKEQMMAYPVNANTQVSKNGGPWAPLYTFPELMELCNRNGGGYGVAANNEELNSKKTLCGIMAIFLGYLGVQYFILGKVGGGIVTILLTLVTCGLWSVLTLVQGIMMLVMSPEEFRRKYVDSPSFMPLF